MYKTEIERCQMPQKNFHIKSSAVVSISSDCEFSCTLTDFLKTKNNVCTIKINILNHTYFMSFTEILFIK